MCGCSGRSSGGCGRCPFSLRIRLVDLRICHPELCLQVAFLLRARCALNPWVLEKVHGALHQFLPRRLGHGPFASFLHSPPAPLPPNHGSYTPLLPPSPAITPHSGRSRKPPSWAAAPRKLVASSRSRPAAPADPRGARRGEPPPPDRDPLPVPPSPLITGLFRILTDFMVSRLDQPPAPRCLLSSYYS